MYGQCRGKRIVAETIKQGIFLLAMHEKLELIRIVGFKHFLFRNTHENGGQWQLRDGNKISHKNLFH